MQHDVVKEYYGKILKTSADLKTSACCSPEQLPAYIRLLEKNESLHYAGNDVVLLVLAFE